MAARVWYCSSVHLVTARQPRVLVAVGADTSYSPIAHTTSLKAHVRSVVAVPSTLTTSHALHMVSGVHGRSDVADGMPVWYDVATHAGRMGVHVRVGMS